MLPNRYLKTPPVQKVRRTGVFDWLIVIKTEGKQAAHATFQDK
jgi:hypothetical protein